MTLMPARRASISPARCPTVPLPACAMLNSPGFAFAALMKSASVRSGESARTASTTGCEATSAMGEKSFSASKGIFE
ncbi:hypothetical protein D9M68_902890 [compost metagenome]